MMRRSIDLTQQAEIYITASPGSPGEKPTRERPSSRVSCRFVPLLAAKVRSLGGFFVPRGHHYDEEYGPWPRR